MKKLVYIFSLFVLLFASCKNNNDKKSSGADDSAQNSFLASFPEINVPFQYSDTNLTAKTAGETLIKHDVYSAYVPDTLISKIFDSSVKPDVIPVGKITTPDVFYLLTKASYNSRNALFITAYNHKNEYIAGLPVMRVGKSTKISQKINIDKQFNISKDITKQISDDVITSGHDVYVLNSAAKQFTLIMTDSLGDGFSELSNPIDTLPRTHKYAGDYGDGKETLISVRDAQSSQRINFFMYLEFPEKGCKGEIKGEAVFTSPETAEYRQGGDPCVIQFIFSKNKVTLREVEGCGSRLGKLDCKIEGVYSLIKPGSVEKEKTASAKSPTQKKSGK